MKQRHPQPDRPARWEAQLHCLELLERNLRCQFQYCYLELKIQGRLLAQSVGHVILDLGGVSSSPTLAIEPTKK